MSGLWSGSPTSIRVDDLDVICAVLDCSPLDLLIPEPAKVDARRPRKTKTAARSAVQPRLGRHTFTPPA